MEEQPGTTWELPPNARGARGAAHFAGTDWEDVSRFRDFLPQPYRMLDQMLNDIVDEALELSRARTKGDRENVVMKKAEDLIPVAIALECFTEPEQAELVNADSVVCPLYDSLVVVGTSSGAEGGGLVVLLDTLDPSSVIELIQLEPGFESKFIASVAPPPTRAFTMLALVARAPGKADQLLVYQLAIVSLVEEDGASWKPILLASLELPIRATALQLSPDGHFAAVLGSAGEARAGGGPGPEGEPGATVQVFALPEPRIAETLAQAAQAVAAGSAGAQPLRLVLDAAPPPPPFASPSDSSAWEPPAATCHFVMAPMHRAVGERIRFVCAGLYLWGRGGEQLSFHQLLPGISGEPPVPGAQTPTRRVHVCPAALTASALNATTTLLALGYADGSVALYDTTVHCPRYELQRHASGLPVRLLQLDRSRQLLSVDGGGTLHVYDISRDPELGCGKLALRSAPLVSLPRLSWAALCGCLPLVLALAQPEAQGPGSAGPELLLLDLAGARVCRVQPPAGLRLASGSASAARLLLGEEQLLLLACSEAEAGPELATEEDGSLLAAGKGAAPEGLADAAALAAPRKSTAGAGAGKSRAGSSEKGAKELAAAAAAEAAAEAAAAPRPAPGALLLLGLAEAVVAAYPPLRERLGGNASSEQVALVLRTYSHEQRSDSAAMPHPLLLESATRRGTSVASRSRAGSRAGSRGKPSRAASGPRTAPAAAIALGRAGSVASVVAQPQLSEANLNMSGSLNRSASRGSLGTARESRADQQDRQSSVGSTGSGIASKGRVGEQEYNDGAARVAKLLQARHYTRFAREARTNRRMDELAIIAAAGMPAPTSKREAPGTGRLAKAQSIANAPR